MAAEMVDKPVEVPVIGRLRDQVDALRMRAEEVRTRVQEVVNDAVGMLPPDKPKPVPNAPDETDPIVVPGGLLGDIRIDLEAIGEYLDVISREFDRL